MGKSGKHAAKSGKGQLAMLILVPVVFIGVIVGAFFLGRKTAPPPDPDAALDGRLTWKDGQPIGYAAQVVTDDPETLQNIVNEMYRESEEDEGVTLHFKEMMISDDGINFSCFIGNSKDNDFDMFFTIYGEDGKTEIYRSQLLRPGSRLEKIALMERVKPGRYTWYICYFPVKDVDDGYGGKVQTIYTQINTAIDVVVNNY